MATKFPAPEVGDGEGQPLLWRNIARKPRYDTTAITPHVCSDDPEKGGHDAAYSTFPTPSLPPPSLRDSSSLSKPTTMRRIALAVILFSLAFLALSSALPWAGDGLLGRQLSAPPPPDFLNHRQLQNITLYDPASWTLSTSTLIPNHYQTQPYVANGYHGSRIPAEGIGYWVCL